MSAAFSAIMTTGELVFPDTSVGITEQSNNSAIPLHRVREGRYRRRPSDRRLAPFCKCPKDKNRRAVLSCELQNFIVTLCAVARTIFFTDQVAHRLCVRQLSRETNRRNGATHIRFVRQII